jgi:ribose 5-phosphate isomerase RpiB
MLLEDLRRAGSEICLPKDALITPAARDWLKARPVPVTWEEPVKTGCGGSLAVVMEASLPEMRSVRALLDRAGGLAEVIEPAGGRSGLASATRRLCGRISRREIARGVVFAQDGALPVCIANKHNGIRAALGANVPSVEEACRELGINVLVIEYPAMSVWQMRQMIARFRAGSTAPRPETLAAIEVIEQGGGQADW